MPIKIGTSINEITAKVIHSYFRVESFDKKSVELKNRAAGIVINEQDQVALIKRANLL
jgi:hypothetical protein